MQAISDEFEISLARGAVAAFSPKRPMIVGLNVYRAMVDSGHFDDLMDRVRVVEAL